MVKPLVYLLHQWIWYFSRYTIFSRMKIIFFSDAGNVTFRCTFFGTILSLFSWRKGNIIFVTFINIYRKYHISMYVLTKTTFHFLPKQKISFQILQKRSYSSEISFFWKYHLFKTFEENIFPCIFFEKGSSLLLRIKNKIIFSGKWNIIFLDSTGRIIFQCGCFGKTIFSEHLEKKICYLCSESLSYR